ncbi:hypothetical protein GM921_12205 [Pedobacter sp. LMG 31464]|uniref:VOC domain-containing protein n=1 Tax=Pedobacter planticolens TaxID=2679964 RepID=A0A923DY79_9SPHI|nr:VOC family protein [Pedobacter planticolens]MBB2146254.1 hypothetical protein [Pedobacter planticolens]
MSLSIKYVPISVSKLETAIAFFKEQLGLEQTETSTLFQSEKQLIVKSLNGDTSFLLLESNTKQSPSKIVLKTDDCIKDYHTLSSRGVVFQTQPNYLNEGLSASFSDPFGNQYVLLEERSYVED